MTSNLENKKADSSRLVIWIGVIALALTLFAVAIPNLMRSRVAANEASAVGSIRTLNTALAAYSSQHPNKEYPQNLSDLAPQIGATLSGGQKSGYEFRYMPEAPDTDGLIKAFRIEASPFSPQTGIRHFSSDETGEIRYRASLSDPEKRLASGSSEPEQKPGVRTSAGRMLRKASLNLIVANPSEATEKIRFLAARLGGYAESVRFSDEGSVAKSALITIRVPADRLDEARHEVRGLGERVNNEQDDARDVTAQHVDLASHLRNYRVEEAQYLNIMRRSGTIKDTLAVSERLADVRGRIERTQGQLDRLAHQTQMALLEVSLRTELPVPPVYVRWRPVVQAKAAFWTAADDLSTYANFMIQVLFRLPVFALWTLTTLISFFGGWRLFRWTWRRFAPSSPTAA